MKNNCERLWKILPQNEYIEIKEKDIIKLGRVRLKFDKVVLNKRTNPYENIINMNYNSNQFHQFKTNISLRKNHMNHNNYSGYHNLMSISSNNKSLSNHNNNHNMTSINNSISNVNNNDLHNSTMISHINLNVFSTNKNNIKEHHQCRICYNSKSELNNPLISPCNCTGSMGHIHLKCLKQCLLSRMHKKEDEYHTSYIIKSQKCEICLKEYPKIIQYKNIVYNLIDFDFDKYENYSLCDYSIYDDTKKQLIHKGYILINLTENTEITIGRNQSNIVKLKDISVSRTHCVLLFENGKLMLKDKKSKFGTLIYLKDKIKVDIGNEIECVSGKHLFKFCLTQEWSLFHSIFGFGCCSCKNNIANGEEEFVVNLDKNIQKVRKISDKFNEEGKQKNKNEIDDSYEDYILNLNSVFIDENEEEEIDINIQHNNNNNHNINGINPNVSMNMEML